MKALVLNKPYEFQCIEKEIPSCGADQVLVKVDAVCICGSDAGAIKGTHGMFVYPRVLGHEVAGTVFAVGSNVSAFNKGDKVCLMPTVSCKTCKACKKGKTNACTKLNLIGVHIDGGLEEYLCADQQNWLKIDADISPEEIAMIEPLTIGAHAVSRFRPKQGDQVLVIGAGPIGVSCAENAVSYGASIVLADTNDERLKFIADRFGFKVLNVNAPDYIDQLKDITNGEMFDAVMDTTAFAGSMQNTWKYICNGGSIVFIGIAGKELVIDGPGFHSRETSLYVSRNSVKADYERVVDLIKKGQLHPSKYITHRITFEQAETTLNSFVDPKAGVFKGVVTFGK